MNGLNAFLFVTMGSAMGFLPHLFPSLFPPTGADESSTRALWLSVVGATQVAIGLAYIAQAQVFPFAMRLVAMIRGSDTATLALPKTRAVSGR
jgi:hypothetical protein